MNNLIASLNKSLIVSCQAPTDSPLHDAYIIAAMAQAAVNNGAIGVRIDTPNHIKSVREKVQVPIIGLWKQIITGSDVYITPQFHHAVAVAQAGADIIAIDATTRNRPGDEKLIDIIKRIHQELGKPVMADVDTFAAAKLAVDAGADIVGTTLFGYTAETKTLAPPGWELLTQIVENLDTFIICEGGISSPEMAKKALNLGANAVVVGGAITGIDLLVKAYKSAL
ncbi:N-acetylmannosamine-6-phosphate 2-epimerase [Anabaena cylindrica FACHB-243]|uniref:Putative N-acetylmannosamine-6-phosphate 2-epimerase n=1 Tax=Anabaena cylindrica (strain ATCC 27899 / PCC 7122) TaxID=272123 RepID=K9ZHT3_ANACC|nr:MULTISPECIES: N-acetylmannosamine-6-phosphate 2-epimerase [Anabaena]AFZ58314.1 N-acetylmannosamine-6-phosphate 2-epimerase [Anabaena cylindrica PCC 7122]MBD2416906.1 N-acetylmannosamine-6-phosphate 2-epimerase [Anabaena cylindrica FACHB-243]MBY5281917.1 N-acetylmannosamine-6-phosphate 2-epimerase [Anabaena sp. CCAP 1446/1C]MBY5308607.1 N-acetylmannosamine-6-phosphate 2-epimerase [Anabaena sp. CCAP 1446/1C]MCM2406438.1 N-acetylmannosamine-6-phosphate 2-epimerase [Anabaena sp. CCAP 1446/1C]